MNRTEIPKAVLGCMLMGKPDWGISEKESYRILDTAVERNFTYLDTANFYARGNSERIIGKWLKNRQTDKIKVMTKVGGQDPDDSSIAGLSAKSILKSLEKSLIRLQTEHVFAVTLHWPDSTVAIEDTLAGIQNLFERKLIDHWNLSNYYVGELVRICEKTRQFGLPLPYFHHLHINLLNQEALYELIPESQYYGMKILAWSPLNGGLLTDAFELQNSERFKDPNSFWNRFGTAELLNKRRFIELFSQENNVSIEFLALKWLDINNITPIIGVECSNQIPLLLNQMSQGLPEPILKQLTNILPCRTPYDVIAFSKTRPRTHLCQS